jgi:hypothetical protein
MSIVTKETDSRRVVTAILERALPLAGLAVAVINLAWIGFLRYGLAKLL